MAFPGVKNGWDLFVSTGIIVSGHPEHQGKDKYCCACKNWGNEGHLGSDKHRTDLDKWSRYTDYDRLTYAIGYLRWDEARAEIHRICVNTELKSLYDQMLEEDTKYQEKWYPKPHVAARRRWGAAAPAAEPPGLDRAAGLDHLQGTATAEEARFKALEEKVLEMAKLIADLEVRLEQLDGIKIT